MRGWIFRIAIIGVIALGAFVFRDRLSGNAGDLAIADCFDVPAGETAISDVQHHPCTESHTGEVFAVVTHPAAEGTPPITESQLVDYLTTACAPVFLAYVGPEAATAGVLDFGAFYPGEEDWNSGDRKVTCYAYRIDDAPMTSSVKKTP
jgi:ABC-type molybdate transport system substrate-binding protein